MKTKIIYISGNEVFSPADIRAAFDEVRVALGLDSDTVLFGVPVEEEIEIQKAEKPKKTKKVQVSETVEEPTPESTFVKTPVDKPVDKKEIPILSVLSGKPDVETDVVDMIIDEVPDTPAARRRSA